MLVHLCPLSLSAQFVSLGSLRLHVPVYLAGGQTRDVDQMLG